MGKLIGKFEKFENLPVVSRSALRPAQSDLYDLIIEKLKSGMPVTLEEAETIWRKRIACRRTYNGIPHRSTYVPGEGGHWYLKEIPMTKEEVVFAVLNWLTKNIGVLVMRGYLKVIPMVQLEPSKSLAPTN